MKIRCISPDTIRNYLTPDRCIDLVDDAMRAVSSGNVELPLRWGMKLPNGNGVLGMMPGYLGEPECFGIKLVSLFPGNTATGLSSHLGLMVLYEPEHGQPVAIMNADVVTALRTAAASALATRELARPDASVLAILGTGEQARAHVPAMLAVRNIEHINIWGRRSEKAAELATELAQQSDVPISTFDRADQTVANADIICTVTASREPILNGEWMPYGAHVNLVGSSVPNAREVDSDVVVRSRFFVDYRASTMTQAGEFLKAIEDGLVGEDHIAGEIGEVLLGRVDGRASPDEITVYKSLGVAAQDLAAARYVYEQASAAGAGVVADL